MLNTSLTSNVGNLGLGNEIVAYFHNMVWLCMSLNIVFIWVPSFGLDKSLLELAPRFIVWLPEMSVIFVVSIFKFLINDSFRLSQLWPDPSSSSILLLLRSKKAFSLISLKILSVYPKLQTNL